MPLYTDGDRFDRLASQWLPFYDDELRRERLARARWFVLENNLARIPWYVGRELHFQAFDRFYRAFQGFLLGLHVSRRTYPLDYNKWIREQVAENLGLPPAVLAREHREAADHALAAFEIAIQDVDGHRHLPVDESRHRLELV